MNIIEMEHCADSYFLRTADVEPDIMEDGSLKIYNGHNGYGNKFCSVTNIVVYNDDHLTGVICAWHCRHSGSQFWRYYRDGEQVYWKSLSEADRLLILDAYEGQHVPEWAKRPGKLERDYIRGRELNHAEVDELWENNELTADQEPTAENSHGIYCVKSRKSPILNGYIGQRVRLALSGTVIEGETGFRAEHAQIVEALRMIVTTTYYHRPIRRNNMTKSITDAVREYRKQQAEAEAVEAQQKAKNDALKALWEADFQHVVAIYIDNCYGVKIDFRCVRCVKHENGPACTVYIEPFVTPGTHVLLALFVDTPDGWAPNENGWAGQLNASQRNFGANFIEALAFIAPEEL